MNRLRSHLRPVLFLLAVGMLAVGFRGTVQAYPEPAQVSSSWNIEITWQTPRAISVQDVDGRTRWFWYMPYKVVNNTGADRLFVPEFTLATDTGRIMEAGQRVPASLFPRIREQLRNPLLENPLDIAGHLRQGGDFARESVAIWPAFENEARHMTIFVAGLSGETATIHHPLTQEPILLRRSQMIRFDVPGTPTSPQHQPVRFREQREVMR